MNATTRMILGGLFVVCLAQAVRAEESNKIANAGANIGRGFANIVTCPLELVRTLSYDVADNSLPGLFSGIVKGPLFTVSRLWGGFMDVMCLGCCPEQLSSYQQMGLKDFAWQEKWWPAKAPVK